MDVFALHGQLIEDYAHYIQSFIRIRDERIRAHVETGLDGGLLWPPPLVQLNPSFAPGPTVDELVADGSLHPRCAELFRVGADGSGRPLRFHRHQAEAIVAAQSGESYVLTTGTGSGKSLAYIVPIVDHVLRTGSGRGVQAIVVYPMNALANSQEGELRKFLQRAGAAVPVSFRRYTGQESEGERDEVLSRPPDIILTNYVMLELMLTRPQERPFVAAAQGLRFLVLDELHTYRGRQGSDVALLVRRLREQCNSPGLQCIGTSATLAEAGTLAERQTHIATVASRLFGTALRPERVIGETLTRATAEPRLDDPAVLAELGRRVSDPDGPAPGDYAAFRTDPLMGWIETTLGLAPEPGTGRLRRATPLALTGPGGAADRLADLLGLPREACARAIAQALAAGYQVRHPDTGFPAFAFRLHQFIGRGDTVYASLGPPDRRHLSTTGQHFVPGDRARVLLPLAFCRACGQEYYVVRRGRDPGAGTEAFVARDLRDQARDGSGDPGFLHLNPDEPWPADEAAVIERVPEDWLERAAGGRLKLRRDVKDKQPAAFLVDGTGTVRPSGQLVHFIPTPFAFCLHCGIAYSGRTRSDFGKLAALSSEGRSTATTVLSLAALLAARRHAPDTPSAHKLLSFTDNRQDASLQAGHFNDFVEIGLLRAALYAAVTAVGPAGVEHDQLASRVAEALALPIEDYAANPQVSYGALDDTRAALREVLGYRLYRDLRRGWRITAPNLEQCGLLEIHYPYLDEIAADEALWPAHPVLTAASPAERAHVARTLLDFLRRELVIKVGYLDPDGQDRLRQRSAQRLIEPWAIDENERLETAAIAFPRGRLPGDYRGSLYVSPRGGFGQFLRRAGTLPDWTEDKNLVETERVIQALFQALTVGGLVEPVTEAREGEVPGYQVPAAALRWLAGDGRRPYHDPIAVPRMADEAHAAGGTNPFFVALYTQVGAQLRALRAHEHTAQVGVEDRQAREADFRAGRLPVLFCSPTMELGVDIAQLNLVGLRNVPPTPANYAQRSGRAGRSGQPALVFTYCTSGSPHDQYFFKRPERMVAGSVAAPRLDLANEDLLRAHVRAIWLAQSGLSLGHTLKDVLDLTGEAPSLALRPEVLAVVRDVGPRRAARNQAARVLADLAPELAGTGWYGEGWLDDCFAVLEADLEAACQRWRDLYRAAMAQRTNQNRIIGDASRSAEDKRAAKRLRAEAEEQIALLSESQGAFQGDFYSYRYFASEGFLPGYNFPRLPLSAFIGGRRVRSASRTEFVSRPRFLAIAEFGPQSVIYHEGTRYQVNQVILPALGEELSTTSAKLCPRCGYLHPALEAAAGPDLCEQCGHLLGLPLAPLFQLRNVSTRRRERINSDEEERTRMGYELRSGVRLGPEQRRARVLAADGSEILRLTYGPAATIWRINLGWRRRRNRAENGFVLDLERGYWAREAEADGDDEVTPDPLSPRRQRVIPFVQDRRNCLLVEPVDELDVAILASLQPALKNAIQVRYQLEDSELAAEALPSRDERRLILLYEATEGGAGVLRRLVEEPAALAEVAAEALGLCHFDPASGADLRRAERAAEDCEAACYDCLMSYTNQPDHRYLDRHLVLDLLRALAGSRVLAEPVPGRGELDPAALDLPPADPRRRWLDYLGARGKVLPAAVLAPVPGTALRADFLYPELRVAVFVGGAAPGSEALTELEDAGWTAIVFAADEATWDAVLARAAYVFGPAEPAGEVTP